MEPFATRSARIQPFHVMRLLAEARALEAAGRDIVHMEVGEPDFETPDTVRAAAHRALDTRSGHYTPALGLPALREAIAAHYRERFDVAVPAERIVVTPGASGALQLLFGALVDRHTRVLLADPGYPCNRNFAHLFDGEPVAIPVGPDTRFQLTPDLLDRHWQPGRRHVVLVTTPSNPTGSVLSLDELAALHAAVRERGGVLVVDEIYQGLVYEAPSATALALGEDLYVLNSFSKYFGMTGWRVGWLVAPASAIDVLDRLAQNLYLAAPTLAQWAALAALDEATRPELEARRDTFRERRDYLLEALCGLGFCIPLVPQGAFYVYADSSRLADDSAELCRRLLHEAGVAVTPGLDFGEHAARCHLRFAYTTSLARLREGVARMARFVRLVK